MTITPSQLALGFIGGGLSSAAGATHYSACGLDGIWNLEAGAFSRHGDINLETANKWHVDANRLYDDWHKMIDNEKNKLDAVCILTHTPNHAEVIEYVLNKNIPIICEKSITMDVDESNNIRQKLNPKKNFFASIFNYTGYPLIRELKERIAAGDFGKIQQIHIEMPQEGFSRPPSIAGKNTPPQSWRLSDGKIPTICLDLGVHMLNMINFLTNEDPTEVFAEFSNYSVYKNIVDYVQMMLRFGSGMKGSLWMTKTAIGHRNGLTVRVYGEKASSYWYQMSPEELQINHLNGLREIVDRASNCRIAGELRYNRMKPGHPSGFIEAFANLYYDIAGALQEFRNTGTWSTPYVYGFDAAAKGLEIFEAAVESNKKQKWASI